MKPLIEGRVCVRVPAKLPERTRLVFENLFSRPAVSPAKLGHAPSDFKQGRERQLVVSLAERDSLALASEGCDDGRGCENGCGGERHRRRIAGALGKDALDVGYAAGK